MIFQRVISGGRSCYVGSVTLSFLREHVYRQLPPNGLIPSALQPLVSEWLNVEEKDVDAIANFVYNRVSTGGVWCMGSLKIGIFGTPSFESKNDLDLESSILGSLKWTETEAWIPLDSDDYQRMLGMFRALSALYGKERSLLAQDSIPVTLFPLTSVVEFYELAANIRKSKRSIDRGEVIRTAVDDVYATYARWLMGGDQNHTSVFSKELINWKSNTLTNRLRKFSTLSVLYDSAKMIDQALGPISSLNASEMTQRYNEIAFVWKILLERFVWFRKAISQSLERLPGLRKQYLCLKPTGQLVVIAVMTRALRSRREIPVEEVIERINAIPWSINDPLWKDIIVIERRVNGSASAITLASYLVAYLINLPLSDDEMYALKRGYARGKGRDAGTLPNPFFRSLDPGKTE